MPHYAVRIKAMGGTGVGLIEADDEQEAVKSALQAAEFQVEVVDVADEDVQTLIARLDDDPGWQKQGTETLSMPGRIDGPVI